ncbi:MAG: MOSC domain-containing protein [Kineosporiaceae bacterium]
MATTVRHRPRAELEDGLPRVLAAPRDHGSLCLVVRRPRVDERELLDAGELSLTEGLVGDTWRDRPSSRTPDRSPHPDMQLNIMGARYAALLAGGDDRAAWALAGDQLYVDLDLSHASLPPGSRLAIGAEAVIEVTDQPHRGCAKFADRFGRDAHHHVQSPVAMALRLRGLNARVVSPGTVRPGDRIAVTRP